MQEPTMQEPTMQAKHHSLTHHFVWDKTVRLFHWINVLCVLGLVAVGVTILNSKALGVSTDGKILLKTIHVYIGYLFFINLSWRIIWGFISKGYGQWKTILPWGKGYGADLKEHVKEGKKVHLGHNPLARLMVTFLIILLSLQAVTGLVLAGTDLYFWPFGHEIAEWVTNAGEDHSKIKDLKPYSKENIDEQSYQEMRAFRKPFITTHVYVFYTLLAAIALHIAAVVISEIKTKNGLLSAMITGYKTTKKED